MKEKRYIVDTTLRDGEQSPGHAFTQEQKISIALMLDEAGVYQIEAGIPVISGYEKETLAEISHRKKQALISVWNRLNMNDIRHSFACNPDIIHISVPVSYVQIYTKLHKNKAWVMKSLAECVDLAQSRGYTVTIGFEDASRADATFMLSVTMALKEMGVTRVRFADTVGVLTPSRTYSTIKELIQYTEIEVEMHAHNDLGMAVANSVAAAKAGAKYIDTTILGIGERAGNCNLEKFIFAAELAFSVTPNRFSSLTVQERVSAILNSRKDDSNENNME